jgi:hypothetical protein
VAGDGKFSTLGNWLGNKDIAAATTASKIYISVPSDATLNCDIDVKAGSITFPAATRGVTIDGVGSFELTSVTNNSTTITPVIGVPVLFTGNIDMKTTAAQVTSGEGIFQAYSGGAIDFVGGATGVSISGTGSNIMKGILYRTNTSSGFSVNTTGAGRWTVTSNSTVFATGAACGNTTELLIQEGGRLVVNDKTINADQRLFWIVNGEFVINNKLTYSWTSAKNVYSGWNASSIPLSMTNSIVKVGGISLTGACYPVLGYHADTPRGGAIDWYIGKGGIMRSGSGYYCLGYNANDTVRFHPQDSDFTIGHHTAGTQDVSIGGTGSNRGGLVVFDTADTNGVKRTITMDAIVHSSAGSASTAFIEIIGG